MRLSLSTMGTDYYSINELFDTEDYLCEIGYEIEKLNEQAKQLGITEIVDNWDVED